MHYYIEDFEDGTLTSSEGRTDRRPLLPTTSPRPADETAATLTKGGHGDGVSYPGRRKEDDENLVVVSESDGLNPVPSLGGVDGAAPGDTTSDSLTDDEPQTFDWQLSGGGGDKSFRGKGRSWIEDKPGTARSLSTTKTLAVYDPAKASGETGEVAHTLQAAHDASEDGTGRGTPLVSVGFTPGMGATAGTVGAEDEIAPTLKAGESGNTRTPAVFTKLHGAQDAGDHETWDEADVARTQNGLQHATELVVQPDLEATSVTLASDPISARELAMPQTTRNGDPGVVALTARSRKPHPGAAVRRLTPRECERLQGFPDDWTQLGGTADGPRYAALGDAVTVNVGQYIVSRIVRREQLA